MHIRLQVQFRIKHKLKKYILKDDMMGLWVVAFFIYMNLTGKEIRYAHMEAYFDNTFLFYYVGGKVDFQFSWQEANFQYLKY